jgi:uncharacterized protein YaaQ
MHLLNTFFIVGCCVLSTTTVLSIILTKCNERKQIIINTNNSQKLHDYVEYKYHVSMMNLYKLKLT